MTGWPVLAEEAARKAISLDRGGFFGPMFLGEALCAQGKTLEAISAYQQALAAGGKNPDIYTGLAQACIQIGDLANAKRQVDDLIAAEPSSTTYRALLEKIELLEAEP